MIKSSRIREFEKQRARAAASLELWLAKAKHAEWQNLNDVRATFGNTDQVEAGTGKKVLVFNIGGNNYRLICAAHFNRGNLYVLGFFTHAEYSKNEWKKDL